MPTLVTARPVRTPLPGRRHPAWRDGGLALISAAGVAGTYVATAATPALATAAVVAAAASSAMHARLAMGRWRTAAQVVLGAIAIAALGAPPRLVGVVLITSLGAAALIGRDARRAAILRTGAVIAVVAGLASASGLAATVMLPARAMLREALGAVVGGFLSAPLMLMLGPLAEWLFGHTTRLTLSDWLNYEQPLLRQLATTAPGTFQHSVNVGVLADAAAGEIGADALLARVGGLYHDVGKMEAPAYFIENQHGTNPHDQLDPRESARVLRAHVVDGVAAVLGHHMGERIADFVREHHGTGTMRFFQGKAEALGQPPAPELYRYPGPRPRSRETGLVMIADQLEATARAAPPEDDTACDALVAATIARIQEEGQLDEARLDDGDLQRVRGAFSRALQAMYHQRVTYPPAGASLPRRVFGRTRRGAAP